VPCFFVYLNNPFFPPHSFSIFVKSEGKSEWAVAQPERLIPFESEAGRALRASIVKNFINNGQGAKLVRYVEALDQALFYWHADDEHRDTFLQCSACRKWRRGVLGLDVEKWNGANPFTCKSNSWRPKEASCAAPAEQVKEGWEGDDEEEEEEREEEEEGGGGGGGDRNEDEDGGGGGEGAHDDASTVMSETGYAGERALGIVGGGGGGGAAAGGIAAAATAASAAGGGGREGVRPMDGIYDGDTEVED
jgi:hypothetical protein